MEFKKLKNSVSWSKDIEFPYHFKNISFTTNDKCIVVCHICKIHAEY